MGLRLVGPYTQRLRIGWKGMICTEQKSTPMLKGRIVGIGNSDDHAKAVMAITEKKTS
jgi:hypothetical protein